MTSLLLLGELANVQGLMTHGVTLKAMQEREDAIVNVLRAICKDTEMLAAHIDDLRATTNTCNTANLEFAKNIMANLGTIASAFDDYCAVTNEKFAAMSQQIALLTIELSRVSGLVSK